MSLESAIADLVSASTSLVSAVNVTKTTIEETEAAAAAQVQPAAASATEAQTQASAAATSAGTVSSKLATAAADYAAQRVTKGIAAVQTEAESAWQDHLARNDPARHAFRGNRPSLVMDFVRRECHRTNGGNLEPVDLNSFMTFTRASTGTYTGPDGLLKTAGVNEPRYDYDLITGECKGLLVEEQRTNLFTTYSVLSLTLFTQNGAYLTPAVIASPTGALDAYTMWETAGFVGVHQISQNVTLTDNLTYTVSVYARQGGYNSLQFGITTKDGATKFTTFNLGNAVITPDAAHTASIIDVGRGWYRCVVTYNAMSGVETTLVRLKSANGSTGVGTNSIHLYGPQLEAGAFPTSYIPTPATFTGRASTATYLDANGVLQTADSGVARSAAYDYDADGVLRPVGLLLENSATNLLTQSGAPSDSSWGKVNGASVSGGSISFVDAMSRITKAVAPPDGTYTLSARFSAADVGKKIKLAVWYTGKDGFSYGDTTIPSSGFVSVTVVNATGITNIGIINASTGVAQTVTLAAGCGLQLEAGNYATSYIPTTTAQVTRAADTATTAQVTRAQELCYTTTGAFYNHEGGTLTASVGSSKDDLSGSGVAYFYSSSVDPTHFNSFGINHCGSKVGHGNLGGANVFNSAPGVFAANVLTRIALTYGENNFQAARGGVAGTASTSVKRFRKIDRLSVGTSAYKFNTKECLNGHVRQVVYYPRTLSATDLQALTIL